MRIFTLRLITASLVSAALLALSSRDIAGQEGPDAAEDGRAAVRRELEALRETQRATPVDRAVDRGLRFLLKRQRADGSFGHQAHYRTALTSLSLMAFLARGHVPGDSAEGQAVRRGLEYLLAPARQDERGYFGNDNPGGSIRSGMYGHGITTLLLAELLGMGVTGEQEARIRESCRLGVRLILQSQAVRKLKGHTGGWRYTPESPVSDLSITVWQVMALRAAANAGVEVPDSAIDSAVGFIQNCFHEGEGGFAYQPARTPLPSTVAAGVLAMQVCGVYEAPTVRRSADWLRRRAPRWGDPWIYYAVYYYAQSMHQLGEKDDEVARRNVIDILLSRQDADGSWPEASGAMQENRAGPTYRTAMSILALAVQYHYLPIYQR